MCVPLYTQDVWNSLIVNSFLNEINKKYWRKKERGNNEYLLTSKILAVGLCYDVIVERPDILLRLSRALME